MRNIRTVLFLAIMGIIIGAVMPVFSAPLQDDLFVILKPNGTMGKSPLYPTLTAADSSDAFAQKLYDTIKNDPKTREVLLRYQQAQTDSMNSYKEKLAAEGKSADEISKLTAAKAEPMYFVIKDGKGTPYTESGSAFIQTNVDGKMVTDFHYICPKTSVTKGWEGFSKDQSKPFTDSEKTEFLNLVCHETSHAVMKEMYGYTPRSINPLAGYQHWEGKETAAQLAWTEGYAEFNGAWYSGSDDYSKPKFTVDMDTNIPKTQDENKKTEGVVASVLWDIAKGDFGIKNGMDKINQVLRGKHPWTIDGFAKGFKEMYPSDAAALDSILNENLKTEPEKLFNCWYNLNSARKNIASMEKAYAKISSKNNPIQKAKAWEKLCKAKSDYQKMLSRYQSLYGYSLADLTGAKAPSVNSVKKPAGQAVKVDNSGSNPFSE
ncbi:MAG: hypothetical protein HQM09_20165 [Candidatus Riflebacteria bacterium]|nr:hypothetical protein [Candidatus Riflebacteria bacterium]